MTPKVLGGLHPATTTPLYSCFGWAVVIKPKFFESFEGLSTELLG
jgi:hypothetical protein